MMRSFDWGTVRKEAGCHERGHNLKRCKDGISHFKCKCGARAWVTETEIKIERDLRSKEERRAGQTS